MALRSAVASAAVSRKAGRRRHRLGAFLRGPTLRSTGSSACRRDARTVNGEFSEFADDSVRATLDALRTLIESRLHRVRSVRGRWLSERQSLRRRSVEEPDEDATGSVHFFVADRRSTEAWVGSSRAYPRTVRRGLLLLVSSIIFVDAMLFTALTPLVPGYADEFDLSKLGAGLLVAAFGAGALLGGIPGGIVAARFGPKHAVVGGLVLLAVASFAFALAGGAVALALARFVQGFSSTVTWAGALAWVSATTPRERRGEALGFAFGAAVAGAIIGPMFGGAADAIGIRTSFATLGVRRLRARRARAPRPGAAAGEPTHRRTGSHVRSATAASSAGCG